MVIVVVIVGVVDVVAGVAVVVVGVDVSASVHRFNVYQW